MLLHEGLFNRYVESLFRKYLKYSLSNQELQTKGSMYFFLYLRCNKIIIIYSNASFHFKLYLCIILRQNTPTVEWVINPLHLHIGLHLR
jgi:phosphate starvation-inducible membrane PsiE